MTSDEKIQKAINLIQIGLDEKDIQKVVAGREFIDEQNFPWETVSSGLSEKWEVALEESGDLIAADFEANYEESDVEESSKQKSKRKRMKERNFTRFSLKQLEAELIKLNGLKLSKISMGEMRSIEDQIAIRIKNRTPKKRKETKGDIIFRMLKNGDPIADIAAEADCSNDYVLQCRWNLEQKGLLDARKRRADKQVLLDKIEAEKIRHAEEKKSKQNAKK